MKKHKWYVFNGEEEIFNGSHADCLRYYKHHGGMKAGLSVGYYL